MTASLFVLRAVQAGLSVADLNELTIGFVLDIFAELDYDQNGYTRNATQADMDAF